jgi:hypothetical protein
VLAVKVVVIARDHFVSAQMLRESRACQRIKQVLALVLGDDEMYAMQFMLCFYFFLALNIILSVNDDVSKRSSIDLIKIIYS